MAATSPAEAPAQEKKKGLKLHHWIFIGMGVGLVIGGLLNYLGQAKPGAEATLKKDTFEGILWWVDLFGKTLFIGSLKMIIAPLIFASIISGITSLPSTKELGAIGWKTLAYYVCTTAIAVAIGLAAVLILRPGKKEASQTLRTQRTAEVANVEEQYLARNPGADLAAEPHKTAFLKTLAEESGARGKAVDEGKWAKIAAAPDRGPGDMFKGDIIEPILTNPFKSLTEMNSLGIIFFAILTGLACLSLQSHALSVINFFQGLNEVMMKITLWVMATAPVAIGCLIVSTVARQGTAALVSLSWYCATVVIGILIHICVLLTLVAVIGRMHPLAFIRGILPAWLIAFSTTSSAATLPVTMECVEDNLKVSPKVSNFALPVGATCNMDGTALYEGVAVIFLIQIYGGLPDVPFELGMMQTFMIFITAVLASVGAAAVPSAGLITMAIVADAVGLPLYYIPMLFAVDHLLDQFRTSTNVLGDAAGTVIVHRLEEGRLGVSES